MSVSWSGYNTSDGTRGNCKEHFHNPELQYGYSLKRDWGVVKIRAVASAEDRIGCVVARVG